ncbi:MAG: glycogen/starch synthase [Candidatus Altiarchaeota archaeon]
MGKADYVFEVSYEVCNKIGGIYTVIKSKAAQMIKRYDGRYYTVGYYNPSKARNEFDLLESTHPEMDEAFKRLEKRGIKCYCGEWLIPGKPRTILIEASGMNSEINAIKAHLWEKYNVDSLTSDSWFNDPVIWSQAVGIVLEELMKVKPFSEGKCVAHFHEWLSGAALLYLKEKNVRIGSVFTTHATMLGRTIAASGADLYDIVDKGLKEGSKATPDMAKRYGVVDKHTMEAASAKATDVFTTVSEITGREAEFVLGRRPEVLLFNGLDMSKYPEMEELSILRRKYRHEMRKFLRAYFTRYYDIDMYDICSMFLSGRYEFHNKGIDVYIDSLGRLNERMRKDKSERRAIAFIFVPTDTRGENIQVLKDITLFEDMHDKVEEMLPEIKDNIMKSIVIKGEIPKKIISDETMQELRTILTHFHERRGQIPPLCAFDLNYPEEKDEILKACRRNGLLNRKEDKVKVVFYPAYLTSADRMISMEYNHATLTCDVGVFPSFYEPWGYTPLECAAQATLSITTDLAGFGLFIKGKGEGVQVLRVDDRRYEDIVSDLTDMLYEIVKLEKKDITKRRINARDLAFLADWSALAENYVKAHDIAAEKL